MTSHSCSVDNAELIRFVAVQPMDDRVPEDEKADVRQRTPGKHLASLYLPPAPGLPECVANLDIEFSLPRSALGTDGSFFSNRKKRWEPILVPFEDLISSRVASLMQRSRNRHRSRGSPSTRATQRKATNQRTESAWRTCDLRRRPRRPLSGECSSRLFLEPAP